MISENKKISVRCLVVSFLAFIALVLISAPAFSAGDIKGMPKSIQIGSGSMGGGFYLHAGIISSVLEKELKIPISAQTTSGSRENIRLLDRKKMALALISANNGYPANRAEGGYKKKYDILAPLIYLYPNFGFFMSLEGSGIRSFKDLKGKRVGWPSRTWDATIVVPWLKAHGMDVKKDIKAVYAGFNDLYTQLGDGSLDAAIGIANSGKYPLPAISNLMSKKKLRFISFGKDAIKKIDKALPYMQIVKIPKGRFGLQEDFICLDIGGPHLYARRDLSEEAAYAITKLIHKNLNQLVERHKAFRYISENPDKMTTDIGVPFHPGAVKYWKEAGLWK